MSRVDLIADLVARRKEITRERIAPAHRAMHARIAARMDNPRPGITSGYTAELDDLDPQIDVQEEVDRLVNETVSRVYSERQERRWGS